MRKRLFLIAIQIIFFVLVFFRNWILKENPFLNSVLFIGIFIGLSYFIFQSFYTFSNSIKFYAANLISLFVLFELMKYITFKSGSAPKYIETPLLSAAFTFVAINLYLGIILVSIYFVNKFKNTKTK
jgi:hypothetical protein